MVFIKNDKSNPPRSHANSIFLSAVMCNIMSSIGAICGRPGPAVVPSRIAMRAHCSATVIISGRRFSRTGSRSSACIDIDAGVANAR